MRQLVEIPIVHTPADLEIKGTPESETSAQLFWQETAQFLEGFIVDYKIVRVYQDTLPDFEDERVQGIIDRSLIDSPNIHLIQKLKLHGATIMGTENLELLRASAKRNPGWRRIVSKRDAYVANRIDETLLPGETGLLFMGYMHRVSRYLPVDISVTTPEFVKRFLRVFNY